MSRQNLPRRSLAALAAGVAVTILLGGCASTDSKKLELNQDAERLYRAYLEDNVNEARQNLQQILDLFQSPKAEVLARDARAHTLYVSYARLYLLEKRAGRKDNAEAALVKARYWGLESYELSEDGWKTRVPLGEFMSATGPDRIAEMIDKLDKTASSGRGPKYAQASGG
jgi:hypothetical protein